MVEPLLEAHTEWVETEDGKRLKWTCPDCDVDQYYKRRHGTVRCQECERIMQAANYSVDPNNLDPNNPKWFLRKVAKRRGYPYDYYYPDEEAETEDPLDW